MLLVFCHVAWVARTWVAGVTFAASAKWTSRNNIKVVCAPARQTTGSVLKKFPEERNRVNKRI
jgi:hypothetical protein